MSEATPRPWRVADVSTRNRSWKSVIAHCNDHPQLREPVILAEVGSVEELVSPFENTANAALIVRAVNSFDALVEGCEKIAHDHAGQADVRSAMASDDYRKGCDAGLKWAQDIARAALAGRKLKTERPICTDVRCTLIVEKRQNCEWRDILGRCNR